MHSDFPLKQDTVFGFVSTVYSSTKLESDKIHVHGTLQLRQSYSYKTVLVPQRQQESLCSSPLQPAGDQSKNADHLQRV